ncbi:putative cell surface glycoprotein [Haloferax elongans ATCC BAA-1513]|uniref:Putative cell surface glycoprotein n=1 Tax=Haloferax elongans ATCC BAA-1513 TaxID=1230453 RepID=M0HF50_HALEO|nr:surface glycoprotein [Haloferax elongans]ELZ81719.1 putative cell surface glycoprotein [Haloferax elongans ATCC BAA-1513]
MTDDTDRHRLRALALSALLVLSVLGSSIAVTGATAAAQATGPGAFTDQGTDAGELQAGDTAVVQTIEITDADKNESSALDVTAVTVAGSSNNTASASDLSTVRILDADGDEVASASPTDSLFGSGQTFTVSDITVPDDGSTTLKVSITVASNVSESAELGLETSADWTENGSSGQTDAVADGVTETLAATDQTENETTESANESTETASPDDETTDTPTNETTDEPTNETTDTPTNETTDEPTNETTDTPTNETTQEPTTESGQTTATNETTDNTTDTGSSSPTLNNSSAAPDLQVVSPTNQTIVESDDLLDVTFGYVEDVPSNITTTKLTLTDGQNTYTYAVDKTDYVAGATVTVPLDLDKLAGNLTDGAYNVEVAVANESGHTETARTASPVVVVNDENPTVGNVSLASPTTDIAPNATLNLTYDYESAPNATTVTVWVVDDESTANFTAGDLENASYTTYEQSVDHGVVENRTLGVDLADQITDNANYSVFLTATDATGMQSNASMAGTLDVNADNPRLESVEATVGSDTVTVQFSEVVVAGDGDSALTRADFAYQDGNGAGPGSISSVVAHSGDTVVLRLDANVTFGDLGSDRVNARSGQLVDSHDTDARAVGTDASALADTTPPTIALETVPDVNTHNIENYSLTLETGTEPTDVEMNLTGPNGASVSTTKDATQGTVTLSVNASAFADGATTLDVTMADRAGNDQTVTRHIVTDTVPPTFEFAETNAGTKEVALKLSESVADTDEEDFVVNNLSHTVNTSRVIGPFVTLTLNESVPPSAIRNESVTISAPSVTDHAGNKLTQGQTLVDGSTPRLSRIEAEPGDEALVLTFTEAVTPGDDETFTLDDFAYRDEDTGGVTAIESVTQTGPQTVVLETNGVLTTQDLDQDMVGVEANSVYDSVGKAVRQTNESIGVRPDLSMTADDGTLVVTVVSLSDITDATSTGYTISRVNRELDSLEGFELGERYTTTLNASDFTKTEANVYRATVSVPTRPDGADGRYKISGSVDSQTMSDQTVVDTTAPHPTDAVLLDVTAEAQQDGTRNITKLRVLFNEPIDASDITPRDVSIEGFDGEVVAVQDAGVFGSVTVVTEGKIQTGNSPTVTIDGDSYADFAGTNGKADGKTVIHTDTLELQQGWNFVSVPAESGDVPLHELDLSGVDAVYSYDAESGSWDAFDPDAWINDFSTLEGGDGYIFVMDRAATIEVNVYNMPGSDAGEDDVSPAPTQQRLAAGWNLVGHYQEYDQNVTTALSSVDSDSVYNLLAHDESSEGIAYHAYIDGDFETMERGEAYWVFVRDDEVYTGASQNTSEN